MAVLTYGSAIAVYGQNLPSPSPPKVPVTPKPHKPVASPPAARVPRPSRRGENEDTEMRISASPGVNVKFCVAEANLKINGWGRNEVRVLVRSGLKFEFTVLEREGGSDRANWIWIKPPQPQTAGRSPSPQCLSGDSIEMDIPVGAALSIDGRSTDTVIDSVKKVDIKIVEGNISLRNVAGGISAVALQGDLIVENSAGNISLDSTTGNIAVFDVTPGQIGDKFKAKTRSGSISLRQTIHRQIEASSISGSVVFSGSLLEGGIYNFKTTNGTITLNLPETVSAKIEASYGFGSFRYTLPLNITYETVSPGGKNIIATIGNGNSNVNLTTSSGRIGIIKKD